MGSFASNQLERSLTPNLLDPRFDHDSCGVGFVATLRNQPTHEILTQALTYAACLLFFRNSLLMGGNNGFTDFKFIFGHDLRSSATQRTDM